MFLTDYHTTTGVMEGPHQSMTVVVFLSASSYGKFIACYGSETIYPSLLQPCCVLVNTTCKPQLLVINSFTGAKKRRDFTHVIVPRLLSR